MKIIIGALLFYIVMPYVVCTVWGNLKQREYEKED